MLAELNGMFAFVLHDKRRNLLFGARDRVGIKALYYARRPDAFAFASELKESAADARPCIVRSMKQPFPLTLRFVPGTASIIRGVSRLMRQIIEQLRLEDRPIRNRSWHPSFAPQEDRSVGNGVSWFEPRLGAAVRRWSLSDVPIGCSLSGGLDSSDIVGLLARERSSAAQNLLARIRRGGRRYR